MRDVAISGERVRSVVNEMIGRFRETAVMRRLVKPVVLDKNDNRYAEEEFFSIVINQVTDKIWFVDGVFKGSSYSFQGIGKEYAEGIGEAESSFILQSILEKCSSSKLMFEGTIKPSDILRALELLDESKIRADVLLTNGREHIQLLHHRNLLARGKLCIPAAFSGYDYDVPVEVSRGLPEGTLLVANAEALGELLIKQSIAETASVSNINTFEYESTLRDLPGLTAEQLPEKVRVSILETVKLNITNPHAVAILQSKD